MKNQVVSFFLLSATHANQFLFGKWENPNERRSEAKRAS